MKRFALYLLTLLAFVFPLSAQISLSPNPSPLVFNTSPGQFDSKFLTISNTGTTEQSYSLLTNPPSLLANQVSYYPFDNSLTDLLSNWNGASSGTYFGSDSQGIANQALGFDGVDDHYETWENNLSFTFSLSFRAKPLRDQLMASEGYYNTARSADYLLWPDWYATADQEGFGIALGTNGLMVITHAAGYMPVLLSYSADLSGWNHYTLVFSALTPKLYINGVLVRTGLSSPRTQTFLSSNFGGAGYGYYQGYLDDLCIYNTALTYSQILSSSNYIDMARFRFQPRTGILGGGAETVLHVRMIDSNLALGTYNDLITLCQMGTAPLTTPVPVVINVGLSTIPPPPDNLIVTLNGLGNTLLEWSPVAPVTRYLIFSGDDPNHPECFNYLGSTTASSYTCPNEDQPFYKFFNVVAYLE